jgi:hypothetical protein
VVSWGDELLLAVGPGVFDARAVGRGSVGVSVRVSPPVSCVPAATATAATTSAEAVAPTRRRVLRTVPPRRASAADRRGLDIAGEQQPTSSPPATDRDPASNGAHPRLWVVQRPDMPPALPRALVRLVRDVLGLAEVADQQVKLASDARSRRGIERVELRVVHWRRGALPEWWSMVLSQDNTHEPHTR